jgi:hypothetical protein
MRLNDLLNAIPVLKHNIVHTAQQHTAIVDAILAGDPERARCAVAEHLDGTGALLRGFLARPTRPARPVTPPSRGTVAGPMTAASQEMTAAGQEMRAASQEGGEAS